MLNSQFNDDLKKIQNEIGEDYYRTFNEILKKANNYYHLGIFASIGSIVQCTEPQKKR